MSIPLCVLFIPLYCCYCLINILLTGSPGCVIFIPAPLILLQEDIQEDFGWKLVHGDVFRPPTMIMLLSVSAGTGVQICIMTLVSLLFACLGFLSPPNRGALMTTVLVLYVFLGVVSGYVSARLYKTMGGLRWKSNVLTTAFLLPGIVFGVFFFLNLVLWSYNSAAAIPFTTLLALLCLW